jgi:hypothetical protein
MIENGGECGSYVVALESFGRCRELNSDEEVLFDLALQREKAHPAFIRSFGG